MSSDFQFNRRSIRLNKYDYAQCGAYFVTVCTQCHQSFFGRIVNGKIELNDAGKMVECWWKKIDRNFPNVDIDEYVVMPNHFHGIIVIDSPVRTNPRLHPEINDSSVGAHPCVRPHIKINDGQTHGSAPTLGTIIQWFKTMTINEYIRNVKSGTFPRFDGRIWQRNYYEHVIRNEYSLNEIREYILTNPQNLHHDELFAG